MMSEEYTEDGIWLPPDPGTTPGWGGVLHFSCRVCGKVTDIWLRSPEPRACRQCLLSGRRPPSTPLTVLVGTLVSSASEAAGLEMRIREAIQQEECGA